MDIPTNDEKLIAIIRDELIHEMDTGLDYIDNILDETKQSGITGAIMHGIEKFVFSFFARGPVREKTIKQMEIIFKCAAEYKAGQEMNALGKKYFKEYLHNDETYHRCERKHPKFPVIMDNIKQGFESRTIQTAEVLKKGKGTTYKDLIVHAYPDRKVAEDFLSKELACVKNEIDIFSRDPSILKISVARERVLEILIKGYEYTLQRLNSNLDRYYQAPAD